jgi:hypothetical protein
MLPRIHRSDRDRDGRKHRQTLSRDRQHPVAGPAQLGREWHKSLGFPQNPEGRREQTRERSDARNHEVAYMDGRATPAEGGHDDATHDCEAAVLDPPASSRFCSTPCKRVRSRRVRRRLHVLADDSGPDDTIDPGGACPGLPLHRLATGRAGGIVFLALAAFHVLTKWGQLDWYGYLVIDGPLFLLGPRFLIGW